MLANATPLPRHVGEVRELLGRWQNTLATPRAVAEVVISAGAAQSKTEHWVLRVRRVGVEGWLESTLVPHTGPQGQSGFYALVDHADASFELFANFKLGVLVILSRLTTGEGITGLGHQVREFFCRPKQSTACARAPDLSPVDLSAFMGAWACTRDTPEFVRHLDLREVASDKAQRWQMRIRLADGRDLGFTPVSSYLDNMAYLAFKGEYELGGGRCLFAANTQNELIVLTSFHRPGAGTGSENRAYRELFARARFNKME